MSDSRVVQSRLSAQQLSTMSPEQVLKTINDRYFTLPTSTTTEDEFDSVRFFLEQDGDQSLNANYLSLELTRHKKAKDSIDAQLAKTVMENYTSFVKGMTKVQEVGLDLTKTSILCKNGRKRLQQAQDDVVKGGLSVLAKYRQRKSFLNLVHYLTKIKDIMEKEKELYQLMEEGDYPAAIRLMLRHRAAIASCSQFHAIRQLDNNIQKAYKTLSKKIEDSLIAVLGSFDALNYERILIGHKLMEQPVSDLTAKVEKFFNSAVDGLMHEVALSYAMQNDKAKARTEQLVKMKFGELCRSIRYDDLLPCLLRSLSELSDLMHNYYSIFDWHIKKERGDDGLNQYDFSAVKKFVDELRERLWQKIQSKFAIYLNSSDFSRFKIDRFLQVYHAMNMLCELGEEFSDKDSHTLRGSLTAKSQTFFMGQHRDTLENMRSMIESETWQRIDFSCLSEIPYFDQSTGYRRNTAGERVDNYIKQVRMFLHTDDTDQNPFKIAFEKGYFQLSDPENEQQDDKNNDSSESEDEADEENSDDEVDEDVKLAEEQQKKKLVEQQRRKGGPILTNASMALIKQMGVYVQSIEVLQRISLDIFNAFASMYRFYAYSVYSMFGEVHELPQNEEAKLLYPETDNSAAEFLKEFFKETREVLNKYNNDKFFMIARTSSIVQPQLRTAKGVYGFNARAVAAESLISMQTAVVSMCQSRIVHLVPKAKVPVVEKFVHDMQRVTKQIQTIIYERVSKSIFKGKYEDKIPKKLDLPNPQLSSNSPYVDAVIKDFAEFAKVMKPLEENPAIPAVSTDQLWSVTLKTVMENIVDGLSKIKSCNDYGRALLPFDLRSLTSKLGDHVPSSLRAQSNGQIPYIFLVKNYVEGTFNDSSQYMLEWVLENRENYNLDQVKNLIQISPLNSLNRKQKNELIVQIESFYKSPVLNKQGPLSLARQSIDIPQLLPRQSLDVPATQKTTTSPRQSIDGAPSTGTEPNLKKSTSMWNGFNVGGYNLLNPLHKTDSASPPPNTSTSTPVTRQSIDIQAKPITEQDNGGDLKKSGSLWNKLNVGGMNMKFGMGNQGTNNK